MQHPHHTDQHAGLQKYFPTKLPKFRLRYAVFSLLALSILLILVGEPREDAAAQEEAALQQAAFGDSKRSRMATDRAAQEFNAIETAAGHPASKSLTGLLRPLSGLVETEEGDEIAEAVRLSEEERALPKAELPTPLKKPYLHLTEEEIVTATGDSLREKRVTVASGDTLGTILNRGGIPSGDVHNISVALQNVYDPRRDLRVGQQLSLYFDGDDFKALDIQKNLLTSVHVAALPDGRFGVTEKEMPTQTVLAAAQGRINSSLYKAALDEDVPDSVILELIRVYSWAVDFQRDIREGDGFEIMYRLTVTEDGRVVPGAAEVVYANLQLRGRDMGVYRFKDSEGDIGYYEEDGRSVRKALMRTPIDGARLSSGFGMRHHPILGYSRMHRGVDFAAPTGTPIYAAGDGRITYIGRNSGYGNYIRIRHHAGLETAYAHMSRFKAGLRNGSRVRQGEVIGYVGATGQATGPHLHYEVHVNGQQVNPQTVKMQEGKKLAGKDLEIFRGMVAQLRAQYVSLIDQKAVRTAAAR